MSATDFSMKELQSLPTAEDTYFSEELTPREYNLGQSKAVKSLQTEITFLRTQNTQLREHLTSQASMVESLFEQIKHLGECLREYQSTENELRSELTLCDQDLKNMARKIAELIRENTQLKEQNQALTFKIESELEYDKMRKEIELDSAKKRIEFLESHIAVNSEELRKAIIEQSATEEARKEMCREVQRLSALECEKTQELEKKTFQVSICMVQIAMLKSELTRLNPKKPKRAYLKAL